MGAWIETKMFASRSFRSKGSHPTWVRGLKHTLEDVCVKRKLSHPTWVRGLKLAAYSLRSMRALSHPTWVRGLKLIYGYLLFAFASRTLRGCVD